MDDHAEKIKDIKSQVEQRIAKAEPETGEISPPEDKISPDFVRRCLADNVLGDAELFKILAEKGFVFNTAMDTWMYWSGCHWKIDKAGRAMAAVSKVAEIYEAEAKRLSSELKTLDDDDPIKKQQKKFIKDLHGRAFALRDVPRAKRVLEMAAAGEDSLSIEGSEVDQKPWLLPCENGVINLETGDIEKGRQTDYLLKHSPVTWAGIDAPAPVFEQTLTQVFSGRQDLIDFFQRCIGLALIGKVLLHVMIVLVGQGRNGKSLLMGLFAKVLGQLSGVILAEMLLDSGRPRNTAAPSPDIMSLRGARMVVASEANENCKISPAQSKWLTGGDPLKGRDPHDKYETEFDPSHTIFLLTNHKPHAGADEFAFWERVVLIPFENSFVDREPKAENEYRADPYLSDKLEAELPGILAWMVRGSLWFQKTGLNPPLIITDAVAEYRREEDTVEDFIEACCIVGPDYKVNATTVYEIFKEWWSATVLTKPPSQRWFGSRFQKRFEKRKDKTVTYLGVKMSDTSLM